MNIQRFEAQHDAILRGVAELRQLSRQGIAENAVSIAQKIVDISSTIKLHLAGEDRMLYPTAQRSGDPSLAKLADRYQQDMGPIAAEFEAFVHRWNTPNALREQAEIFRREANRVLRLLWERMRREDGELYPRMRALK